MTFRSNYALRKLSLAILVGGICSVSCVVAEDASWESLFSAGQKLAREGELKQAEIQLKLALNAAEVYGPSDQRLLQSLKMLGRISMDADNYESAEPIMKRALRIDEQLDATSTQVANDLSGLGLLYLRQGKYAESEAMYRQALNLVQKSKGSQHPDVATCLNNLANLYFNKGSNAEAEALLKQGLEIRKSALGPLSPVVARNLMNLARVYDAEGKHADALPILQEAVTIDEAALGEEHEDLAPALWQLGQSYEALAKFPDAEDSYRKLLSMDEKVLGEHNPTLSGDLDALEHVLRAQGKSADADVFEKRSALLKAQLPGTQQRSSVNDLSREAESISCPVKDKWALVIGISSFKDPSINLKYAAKDATDFRNYLVSEANFKPDHVKLLTDGEATRDNIVANLGEHWLRRLANSNDLVVIYVSSHGSAARQDVNANFIVPYEGNLDNLVFTGIPMQWFTAGIHDLVHCERILLLLDVCHSGAATSSSKGLRRENALDLSQMPVGSGQLVMTSSQADQISWESKTYPNGVFTRRLIEGLRLKGSATTIGEAYDYMKDKIEEEVLRDRAALQTPVLMTRLWKGQELVIQVKPVSPRPGLPEPPREALGKPFTAGAHGEVKNPVKAIKRTE